MFSLFGGTVSEAGNKIILFTFSYGTLRGWKNNIGTVLPVTVVHVEPVKSGHVPNVLDPPLQAAPEQLMPATFAAELTAAASVPEPIVGAFPPILLFDVNTTVESFWFVQIGRAHV